MGKLDGKTVMVTGAGTGFGAAARDAGGAGGRRRR